MRAKPGSEVVLFDGSGAEFSARVERIGRSDVDLAVLERREVDRELPVEITLAVALPKGDRQRWLVEKAVELGVARLQPLRTARSVAQPSSSTLKRLRRAVIEASKQCGRNRLMEIEPPVDWPTLVARTTDRPCRLLAHPGGTADRQASFSAAATGRNPILAVGPEGGFTDEEVATATTAGWQCVDLGPRILRIETACLVMVAWAVDGGAAGPEEMQS